jgi:hypothetical protein
VRGRDDDDGVFGRGGVPASPVFIGLMYDISVFEEPTPLAVVGLPVDGGVVLGLAGVPALSSAMKGDVDALTDFASMGRMIAGMCFVGDTSVPNDLRCAGLVGEAGGGGEGVAVGHRSRTDVFFPPARPALPFMFVSACGGLPELAPSSRLVRTMFCTNPRPCSRDRLGVGGFCCGARKNAADGLAAGVTCGAYGDCFGVGWTARARPGVVTGDLVGGEGRGEGSAL